MSQNSGSVFERPMCDTKGCDNISSFHGFGVDKCWSCYPRFMAARFGLPIYSGGTAGHDVVSQTRQTASANADQMLLFQVPR